MKRGTPRHPKVGRLCELLGINTATAVGLLELLWHFTAEFAPQGDIGKYPDNRIEAACLSWFRPKGKLILALIQAGWIDQDEVRRLIVHDWCDHADESVKKRLQRANLQFVSVAPKVTGQRPASLPDSGSLPEPSLAKPEPEPSPSGTSTAAESAAACELAGKTFDLTDDERIEGLNGNGHGPPKKSLLNPELETALANVAARIHARHPQLRRCGLGEIKNHLRGIARRAPLEERLEALLQVDQNHAGWCDTPDWKKENGQYAKGLDNWLAPTKERWKEAPPVPDLPEDDGYRPAAEWDGMS